MPLPTFLIVGAAKSGTTSLFEYLGQHPDIYVPPCKEPCYFSDGLPTFASTDKEYVNLFSGHRGQPALGEASTSYLYDPQACGRIKQLCGDVRILILLRQPARRAYSAWGHNVYQMGYETLSFEDALAAESERMEPEFIAQCPFYYGGYHYFHSGLYAEQVERFVDAFGAQRVQVHTFDTFAANPGEVCCEVFRFLNVDDQFVPVFEKHNESPGFRNRALHRFLTQPPGVLTRVYEALPAKVRLAAYSTLRRVYQRNLEHRPRPPMSADSFDKLTQRFRPDIERLEALLGRDLSFWYDPSEHNQTSLVEP
jgi:hypothetical protein